jgi:hypothetical protein
MSPISSFLSLQSAEIADLTARLGQRVEVGALGVLDRSGQLALGRPGLQSPNGACRLFRASDGWMALNLAREEDQDLIPAWLGCDFGIPPWAAVSRYARRLTCAELVASATRLGLPAAAVGEVGVDGPEAPRLRFGPGSRRDRGRPKVVDMSALWAGPLCGAILAAMGARVVKIESPRRPDPTRTSTPEFFQRLNSAKQQISLDFGTPEGMADLKAAIQGADILVTSARPRAFVGLGLDPAKVFASNPGLIWVAITGYGWSGVAADRVAFGDDAAAAGGLLRWTPGGAPRFLGDALADPLTGLAAAIGALRGLETDGGLLVDVAMSRMAAAAARRCGRAVT